MGAASASPAARCARPASSTTSARPRASRPRRARLPPPAVRGFRGHPEEGVSMKVRVVFAAALAVAALAVPAAHADPAEVGYPNSIASTGDSITRAFNTCSFPFVDCTSNSWSTGTSSSVNSLYRRILAKNPLISGRNPNDAKTGGKMIDLNGQVTTAGAQGVELVTIL